MRSTLLIVALALVAGGLGLLAGRALDQRGGPSQAGVSRIGEMAPPIALPDLDGKVRNLDEWRGRPRLLNFWASWCGPCIEEMPLLDRFAADQGANGVQTVGIALDEIEAVKEFLERIPARYPHLIEAPGRADSSVRLGNTRSVLPFSVLIDAEGRVQRLRVGTFKDADDLQRWATAD